MGWGWKGEERGREVLMKKIVRALKIVEAEVHRSIVLLFLLLYVFEMFHNKCFQTVKKTPSGKS